VGGADLRAVRDQTNVNMADVAREAGVSTATVSRALRDMPGVSAATRARIRRIADDLSYVVSPEASGLSSGSTGRVAAVVPSISIWYFATMLAGIESALRRADLDVLVYHVENADERQRFFDRLPARRKVDAVVVIAMPLPEQEARRLDLMGVQVVVAGGQIRDYPHVRIDDIAVAHQVVEHFAGLGHTRIAMIRTSDPAGSTWSGDLARTHGFRMAMDGAGLTVDDDLIVTVPYAVDGGAEAMERLLALPNPPTAVFGYSDEVAAGALRTLRRAGVAVPEQISVCGVDNHPVAALLDLTTVHQPVEAQGVAAGQMLVDLIEGHPLERRQLVLPTHLIVRSTTGPPPR
jgi:LacI family transcriptional regulator, repressor for deo operon, udp, cdd, tsx, nupC, and nupG